MADKTKTDIREILRNDSEIIIRESIKKVLPDEAVKKALTGECFQKLIKDAPKIILVAVGKAAWQMANAAYEICGDIISKGIVITKHGYSQGAIGLESELIRSSAVTNDIKNASGNICKNSAKIVIREAGHPVPDNDTFEATQETLNMTENLSENDVVVFLLSGGGSALFEAPLVEPEVLQDITNQLLSCGADIKEMNTIRKRLSKVKGGRFALHCAPAKVFTVILSDIIGDPIDMIASGPAYPDSSVCQQAIDIVKKYNLSFSDEVLSYLEKETPKQLDNVETVITGSVRELCKAAAEECEKLGYTAEILTDTLDCEAKDAGKWLADFARKYCGEEFQTYEKHQMIEESKEYGELQERERLSKFKDTKIALIAGGETVVKLTGNGLGGRNQELALSAARGIFGLEGIAVFSVGSDGTDGPTDAAGGYVDFETKDKLKRLDIDIEEVLKNNDSYHALEKIGGLLKTGPTGTNVNDVAVVLINSAVRHCSN